MEEDAKARDSFCPGTIPELLRWYAAECVSPIGESTKFALLADADDPRLPGVRRRWDVLCHGRYFEDDVWRVISVEPLEDGFEISFFPSVGWGEQTVRLSPLLGPSCPHLELVHGITPRMQSVPGPLVPIHRTVFSDPERLKTVQRRIDAVKLRRSNPFRPTAAMVAIFSEYYGEFLESESLTLDLLRAEPWGVFNHPPWSVRYTLAPRGEKSVLCCLATNRFTNDRVEIIAEDGSLDESPPDWFPNWPVFHVWSSHLMRGV